MGLEVARLVGAESTRGFFTFFARFDLALLLEMLPRSATGQKLSVYTTLINAPH